MILDEPAATMLRLIDEALAHAGAPPLLENPDFEIDREVLFPHYVRGRSTGARGSATIHLELRPDALDIGVDWTGEAILWLAEDLVPRRAEVLRELRILFTHPVRATRRGKHYGEVEFIGPDGEVSRHSRFISGPFFSRRRGCNTVTHPPLYPPRNAANPDQA